MARPRKDRSIAGQIEAVANGEIKPTTKSIAAAAAERVEERNTASHHAEAFQAAIDAFRKAWPAEWAELRLCPLEYGLIEIAERLKA